MRESFGEKLRGFARRTAEIIVGSVVSITSAGDYVVTLDHTNSPTTASFGIPTTVSLSPGQKVLLSRVDGSGRGLGNPYVIIGLSPSISRNNSTASSLAVNHELTAETLGAVFSTGVAVTGVQLTRGGAAVAILIYGTGLTAAVAVYGNAGITDDVAQVPTSTLLTIHPKASGAMAVGRYSLAVANVTLGDFFEVI